ncbi:MAG: Ig-like domain-containing protein, partial [Nisaea sp.]|uniref:Ig-like domain-containing protein n=1 Tax=Nisaea sp. TaxID=2024842 RepID=UPI0032982B73
MSAVSHLVAIRMDRERFGMAKLKKPKIKKILQDTGISQSDFITGNDTIKLVGKAPPKAKIIIYIDGQKVGVAKANKKGVWKFKTDELADGDYNVKVKAKKGKASKKSADKTVVIDTDTDTPVITGIDDDTGTPGDLLTRDTTLTLTGTAEAGARVEISDGAKSLGSVIASAAGIWSFATAVLAQGGHSFAAEATDVAGNARSSSALAVKIDSTPPAAPSKPDLKATSDTGVSDSDNITNDTTPTFSGTAEAGSTVRLYADGLEVGSVVAGGGAWSINASTLA